MMGVCLYMHTHSNSTFENFCLAPGLLALAPPSSTRPYVERASERASERERLCVCVRARVRASCSLHCNTHPLANAHMHTLTHKDAHAYVRGVHTVPADHVQFYLLLV
jgi:hypothetical protein